MPLRLASSSRAHAAGLSLAALLGLAGVAGILSGCGSSGAHAAAATAAVRPWEVQAPYLPPPDPSLLARARSGSDAAARPTRGVAGGAKAPHAAKSGGAPSAAADTADTAASGAPSDAQVAADLREAYGGKAGDNLDQATIDGSGLAIVPPTAPPKLVALMHAANEVARKPYVYGGGHGRNRGEIWEDSAYDCSGSVSYALAAAGYLDGPVDSSTLMSFGRPGPGKWVTIYANGGHTFMVVAGLRFDTSGRQVTGTRWQSADARSYAGFVVRHPAGL